MADSTIIPRGEIVIEQKLSTVIKDFETVASYSWLEKPVPTILVPGIPPVWVKHALARPLQPDSGPRFVDQNADRTPGSPLQALILAVRKMQPNLDFHAIDIVCDRSPIRKLFSFVSGEVNKPFRFGISILGTTALLTRIEKETRENPTGFQGYRIGFEQEYTNIIEFAKDSTSHHRIVKYEFGGMRFLLRFAVDAFMIDKAEELQRLDGVKPEFAGPFVKSTKPSFSSAPASKTAAAVAVVSGGSLVPHAAALELSTKAKNPNRPFEIEAELADLWISKTRNFVMAEYTRPKWKGGNARFNDIYEMEVENLVDRWERANEANLKKLAAALRMIIMAAKEHGCPCVVGSGGYSGLQDPQLTISKAEQDDIPDLPHDLQALFSEKAAKKGKAEAEVESESKMKSEVVVED